MKPVDGVISAIASSTAGCHAMSSPCIAAHATPPTESARIARCAPSGRSRRRSEARSTSSPANRNSAEMPNVDSHATSGSCARGPHASIAPTPIARQVSGAGMRNRCSARGSTSSAKNSSR